MERAKKTNKSREVIDKGEYASQGNKRCLNMVHPQDSTRVDECFLFLCFLGVFLLLFGILTLVFCLLLVNRS